MQFDQRNRRQIVTLLGGAFTAWPLPARGQQSERTRRIGVLMGAAVSGPYEAVLSAFSRRLEDLGRTNHYNVQIEVRWWKERAEQVQAAVTELTALSPDVLVGFSNLALNLLKSRAGSVPIVFVGVGDPVGGGFVASLARPGGNITGFASYEPSMGSKWLEVLKETVPHLSSALVLLHPETPSHQGFWQSIEKGAIPLGIKVASAGVHNSGEIEQAISSVKGTRDVGLIVLPHAVTNNDLIINLEVRYQIPAVHANVGDRAAGALVSYGIDWPQTFKQTAGYVDRILRGTAPRDLPVQQPTGFYLLINLRTAKAMGVDVPPSLLARADEVVQ